MRVAGGGGRDPAPTAPGARRCSPRPVFLGGNVGRVLNPSAAEGGRFAAVDGLRTRPTSFLDWRLIPRTRAIGASRARRAPEQKKGATVRRALESNLVTGYCCLTCDSSVSSRFRSCSFCVLRSIV